MTDPTKAAAAPQRKQQQAAPRSAPQRPPTIRDVAREADVSKSLVSLVFNGGENVSEERRLRVLHAAERLGYRPNLVAQSLSAGKRDFVAILVSNLHNPLFAEIVGAARAQLADAGRRTMIVSAQVDDGDGAAMLDQDNIAMLRDLRPSGLITVGTIPGFAELTDFAATIPTVVASAIDATPDVLATVRSDDNAGVDLVVAHLAHQGVTRIALVGGRGGTVSASRAAAFTASIERRGLAADSWVETADFTEAGAHRAVERMLADGRLPEAIIAVNDLAAIGAITALEAAGIAVPGGCRVAGYDDTTLAAIPRISLTSVDPGNRRIGRDAATALLTALTELDGPAAHSAPDQAVPPNPHRGLEVLIEPRLVVRGSTTAG
ncbi:LacI family DNA-binding transcriptional regulator [Leucobacter sp. HY1908]